MVTRQIPRDEWAEFLDELGNEDKDTLVTVEALGTNVGDQIVAGNMRLLGMTLVEKGSSAGEIEIMVGDSPDNHISHVITAPTRLAALETEEGEIQTLQIEADGEPTTLVHFQGQAQDDLLDEDDEDEDE